MRFLLLLVVFAVLGTVVGNAVARKEAASIEDEFGPLSSTEDLSVFIEKTKQLTGLPSAKILGVDDHDFGLMIRNQEGSHIFQIENVGSAPLTLEIASSTCKCTVGELEDSEVKPGEIADVKLSWTAKQGGAVFHQTATLKTNDPEKPEILLTIHGGIVDSVELHTLNWDLGDIAVGQSVNAELTAFNFQDAPIDVLRAEFVEQYAQELAEVSWEERPVTEEDGRFSAASQAFELKVSLKPGLKQGKVDLPFRFWYSESSGDQAEKMVEARLTGKVVGPIQLLGGRKLKQFDDDGIFRFDVGTVVFGSAVEEKIHLVMRTENDGLKGIEVAEVVPEDVFEVEIGQQNDRGNIQSYPVTLRVKPTAPVSHLNGSTKELSAWVVFQPVDKALSSLKLWLTVDIKKDD